jgi:hypothetical protein
MGSVQVQDPISRRLRGLAGEHVVFVLGKMWRGGMVGLFNINILSVRFRLSSVSLIAGFNVCGLLAHSTRSWWWGCHLSLQAGWFCFRVFSLSLWRPLFTARQRFPSSFTPREREWVASSANHAVPKGSSSAGAAIEVFAVTLARGPHRVLPAGASWTQVILTGCYSSPSSFLIRAWGRPWRSSIWRLVNEITLQLHSSDLALFFTFSASLLIPDWIRSKDNRTCFWLSIHLCYSTLWVSRTLEV